MQDEEKRDHTITPAELSLPIDTRRPGRYAKSPTTMGCICGHATKLRTHITVEVSSSTPLGLSDLCSYLDSMNLRRGICTVLAFFFPSARTVEAAHLFCSQCDPLTYGWITYLQFEV